MTTPAGYRPHGPKKSDVTLVPSCDRCGVPLSEYYGEPGVYFPFCHNCGKPRSEKKQS